MHCSLCESARGFNFCTHVQRGEEEGGIGFPEGGDVHDPSGNVLPSGWRSWCTPTMQPPWKICREMTLPSFNNHPLSPPGVQLPLFPPSLSHTQALHPHGGRTGIQMQFASASLPPLREKQNYSNTLLFLPRCSSGEREPPAALQATVCHICLP